MNTYPHRHPGQGTVDMQPGAAAVGVLALPAHRLTCATCGRELHDHGGSPPDCAGFVRPLLPSGYSYVDLLDAGAVFEFLGRGAASRPRVVRSIPVHLDDANGLLDLKVGSTGAKDASYLVQATTIVRISEPADAAA